MNTDWQLECIGIRNRGAHILKTGEFSDCTFVVGKEQNQVTISAHKIILAMASPVFRAMFYGSFSESAGVISIVDIEADIFKLMLAYIYTDEIEVDSCKKACELYCAANKYLLPYLTKECVKYLSSNLCAENALVVYEFAVFNVNEDLVDKCTKVIREQAKEVLKASSFTDASLETVCMMFSMDPLNIDSELDLFAAAERYLEANEQCADPSKVDEPMNMDDTAPSELNKFSTSLNTQLGNNTKARSKAKFQLIVKNIRSLKKPVYSPRYYVRHLPWSLMVAPRNAVGPNGQIQKTLGIFLQCNVESKSTCWSCYATFTLKIICHKPGTHLCRNLQTLFFRKQNDWGFSAFITWNDLLDPTKGYIKNGSITVEACVKAEAPHGVLGNSIKNDSSVDHRDKLTIRNAVRLIRFLTLTPTQFADGAINSKLLNESDQKAILVNLVSKIPRVSMPLGFCTATQTRDK